MTEATPTLSLRSVTVEYGDRCALDSFSADLHQGSITVILGPNGAGKSTMLRAISGVLPLHAGDILIRGNSVAGDPDAAVGVLAMTPQHATVFPGLTPQETLSYVGQLRGITDQNLAAQVDELLDVMQLGRERTTLARDLSGGMVRKLAVACALIGAPPVILLDESFAGLDPQAVRLVESRLRQVASAGSLIVLVTHRLDLVHRVADRVIFLANGRLSEDMRRAEFQRRVIEAGGDPTEVYLRWVDQLAS